MNLDPFILLAPYYYYGHEHHLCDLRQKIARVRDRVPCCGNCYCSDKCKATDHQKKLIHHTWTDFKHIYESIMKSDQKIRVVTISDLKGEIMYPATAKELGICSVQKKARNLLKWRWKDGRSALNLHQS